MPAVHYLGKLENKSSAPLLKSILYIALLFTSFAAFAQQGCFHAIQDGQEVEVICTSKPVFFRNCTPPGPNTTIFYYPGPEKYNSQTNLLTGEQAITYSNPGTYIVTQFINDESGPNPQTQVFEKTFEVKSSGAAPAFTLTACAGNAISVTVTDETYDTYNIDFGDGNSRVAQANAETKYTYAGAGSYTITVTGNFTGSSCASSSSKQFTTLPAAAAPVLQNLTVTQQNNAGEIQLNLQNLQPGYLYVVERWQDPRINFQKIDTIRNVTQSNISYTVRGVNTAEGVWYLVRVADQCNSVISNSNSNILSSIALTVQSGNEQALLNWQSMPGAAQYEVYRNNTRIATLASTSYTDEGLTCGETYTYFIKGISADGSTSASAPQPVQVTSTTTPAAPTVLASFNLNNEVELSINLPQGKSAHKIDVQRSINGAAYQNLASIQQPVLTDALPKLEPVCYRATFTDLCNNTSPASNITCPIILEAAQQATGEVQLNWTAFTGFTSGVGQYTVEVLDGNGNITYTYPATGTNYTDRALSDQLQVLSYRIRATSADGTQVSYSNLQQVEQEVQVYVPSAFTPNGDGLNDELEVKGRFIQDYTLKVYNSLGNVVFQSTDAAIRWDGTFQGRLLPAGAYAYELVVKTNFGATKRRTGTVTLLR